MTRGIFIIVAVLSLPGVELTYAQESQQPSQAKLDVTAKIELGLGYADSSINTSVFRHSAVLSVGNRVVASFYDNDGYASVVVLDGDLKLLGKIRLEPRIEQRLLGDGHCVISMGRTPTGDVAVVYGAHAQGSILYQVEISHEELSSPQQDRRLVASAWPHAVTYPQFYNLAGGLEMYFRKDLEFGKTSQTSLSRALWGSSGELETGYETLLLVGDYDSVYPERLAVRGSDVAMMWMYRMPREPEEDPPQVRNVGLHVLRSSDMGKTWSSPEGQAVALPLAPTNATLGFPVDVERRPINQNSSTFGPHGTLYNAGLRKDATGIYQIHLAWEGRDGTWHEQVVSDNEEEFELAGAGTLVLPLSRPDLAVSQRYIHVIYRQEKQLVIASRARNIVTSPWRRTKIEIPELGPWEPNYDSVAWENKGVLLLFVQAVRQAEKDRAEPGDPMPVQLWKLEEL